MNTLIPTIRSYYDSDDLEIDAHVVDCFEQDGHFAVVLDRTLFHPKGGGRPPDAGWIDEIEVVGVISRGETILHLTNRRLSLSRVAIQVDKNIRALHSSLHTAGHLLGNAGHASGLIPRKAHHWPGEAKVTFELGHDIAHCESPEAIMSELNDRVRTWIAMDLPRRIGQHDALRTIGFGDLDAYPCGGTHLKSSGLARPFCIKSVKVKGREVSVSYS